LKLGWWYDLTLAEDLTMASFVLVHGAWHGGWCYSRVTKILRAAGHDVFTPTLTGLGERSHLLRPDINLDTHIADVTNVIKWENLSNVVLCGHSYGGMVVTGVADAVPDKVAAVVYLDAFVPEDGDSTMSLVSKERQAMILRDAEAYGGDAAAAPAVELFDVNAADREWVREKLTPQPMGTLQQTIRLNGNYRTPRRTYVYAKGRATSAPFYEKCLRDPTWTVLVTEHGGHDQMIDDPASVADILMRASL
jgi:pimeloyl-ACP methyl ester carboxylesterase